MVTGSLPHTTGLPPTGDLMGRLFLGERRKGVPKGAGGHSVIEEMHPEIISGKLP